MTMTDPTLLVTFMIFSAWLWILVMASVTQNFSVPTLSFTNDNVILLQGAKITANGSLSLILETNPTQALGVGYFKEPVRLVDERSKRTASFSISFKSYQLPESYSNSTTDMRGDGMTLCFSSQSNYSGASARYLGFYNMYSKIPPNLKAFSVEYDTFRNPEFGDPEPDHVGLNLGIPNSTAVIAAGVNMWQGNGVYMYSWVDYNATTQLLEVRVANNDSRPPSPVLSHQINLYDYADEETWVGFSAGTGNAYSFYYIEEWKFTSWGLPPISSGSSMGLIVGLVVGAVVILGLVGLGLFVFIRSRRRAGEDDKGEEYFSHTVGMPEFYRYKQLSVATNGFSEASKLGQGGFGSVYKGVLPNNGMAVAVKRVGADSKQGEREFLAEVSIISQLRHRNIVQLVGWCKDGGKFLLVYELMPNGSLDKALFHPASPEALLTWDQRMKIISGLASALNYLHEGWRQQVIHRDVKSSNVMLDCEFNAKLGDFGLARLVDHSRNAATTLVAGTYGYIAPEAGVTGKFTDKTDVFSFGAVALEVATGMKPCDFSAKDDNIVLVDRVWKRLGSGQLTTVVDKRLEGKYNISELEVVLMLGLLCSHPDPQSRPSMRQVVQVLAGDAPVPPVPATKPSASFSSPYAINLKDLQDRRNFGRDLQDTTTTLGSTSTFTSSSFHSKSSSTRDLLPSDEP
ncbi:hypothetical protein R1flu_016679 [Riccia fluitans]|uniref:Protein kinase domain-containing protein n=1 Tax=Riccia fluitans TaxID=41844 RepID=A0ABD1YMR3_9MARC